MTTSAPPPAAYGDLARRFERLGRLGGVAAILDWDSQTMMPPGGADARAEETAALALVRHELLTDPRIAGLLDRAEGGEAGMLAPWQRANLAAMRRQHTHANAVEPRLVGALERARARGAHAWRRAREDDDFARFAPLQVEVLDLTREMAQAKAEALGCTPYDALLDAFEPGGKAAEIDAVFAALEDFLPEFLGRVLDRQRREPPPLPLEGPFPVAAQAALGRRLMAIIGFDFEHGRLDISAHPFCGGTPDDVRITTRYAEDDFTKSLMGVLHETGHALYERGLPAAWRGQLVGEARSMSLHESQSLLLEMQACRGRDFLVFAAPLMREAFGRDGPAWQPDNLYRLHTRVAPGLIRVDADEVTYPAHVLLRYRLERALIAGDLAVADLPGAWRDGLDALLGIAPIDDRDGCLQDIHWAEGLFGYFPTYTLGAMTAAQLFAAATAADADIGAGIGRGDFAPLLAWLRANVHGHGSALSPREILIRATGAPLDPERYKTHLRNRYFPRG